MLTSVLNNQTIADASTGAGTVACRTLNGVFVKNPLTTASASGTVTLTVTANGNTIANSIPLSAINYIASLQGIPQFFPMVSYLDFGSVNVNGAVEVQLYNGSGGSAANIDVMCDVDKLGKYSCTYAKYTSDTLSAKSVSLVVFGDSTCATSIDTDTNVVTVRSGRLTQAISMSDIYTYGQCNSNGNIDFNESYGCAYKGNPANINLTGPSVGATQFWLTKSIWKS